MNARGRRATERSEQGALKNRGAAATQPQRYSVRIDETAHARPINSGSAFRQPAPEPYARSSYPD